MNTCPLPPPGWYCTRGYAHDGPCAAYSTRNDTLTATGLLLLACVPVAAFIVWLITFRWLRK